MIATDEAAILTIHPTDYADGTSPFWQAGDASVALSMTDDNSAMNIFSDAYMKVPGSSTIKTPTLMEFLAEHDGKHAVIALIEGTSVSFVMGTLNAVIRGDRHRVRIMENGRRDLLADLLDRYHHATGFSIYAWVARLHPKLHVTLASVIQLSYEEERGRGVWAVPISPSAIDAGLYHAGNSWCGPYVHRQTAMFQAIADAAYVHVWNCAPDRSTQNYRRLLASIGPNLLSEKDIDFGHVVLYRRVPGPDPRSTAHYQADLDRVEYRVYIRDDQAVWQPQGEQWQFHSIFVGMTHALGDRVNPMDYVRYADQRQIPGSPAEKEI